MTAYIAWIVGSLFCVLSCAKDTTPPKEPETPYQPIRFRAIIEEGFEEIGGFVIVSKVYFPEKEITNILTTNFTRSRQTYKDTIIQGG